MIRNFSEKFLIFYQMNVFAFFAIYTGKNTQVTANLLQACYLAVVKQISGCVRIACSSLMITRLLQVVNRLDAS